MAQDSAVVDDAASQAVHDADEFTDDIPDLDDADGDDEAPDGPSDEAMAAFLGQRTAEDTGGATTPHDQDGDAPAAGDDALPPELQQLRKSLQGDYTRKTQALAAQRREFEQERREFDARKAALETRQQDTTAGQQQQPSAGPKLTLKDCVDDEGYVDLAKLEAYENQRESDLESRIVNQHLKPVGDKLTAREQAETQREQQAEEKRLRSEFDAAIKAVPSLNDEGKLMRIVEHMQRYGVRHVRSAVMDLFPNEYEAAQSQFRTARARQHQRGGTAPMTPPGRGTGDKAALPSPDDVEAFDEAMAKEAARLTGKPLR